jgi:DNA-binding MarR family transcriptional regulator
MATAQEKSLLHLLHRAVQAGTDRFTRELGDAGLTARQLVVLKAILANEGASQTDIVGITGIDPAV